MQKLQMILVLAYTMTSLNAQALTMPEGPGTKGPKLVMSEEQLIQAIKNDRQAQPRNDTKFGFLGEDQVEHEQLEKLLHMRLQEVSAITYFRDNNSLDNALIFSALALQAWNPELRHVDVKTQIVKNIINFGFMNGFVKPTISMIDLSYATGKPRFGIYLNTMLANIMPEFARGIESGYGVPTMVADQDFRHISSQSREGMWSLLINELGPSFYPNQNQNAVKNTFLGATLTLEIDPMRADDKSMDHFINKTQKSDKAYLNHFLSELGRDPNQVQVNQNSNIGAINKNKKFQNKGVFSNASASEAKSCYTKCYDETVPRLKSGIADGAEAGAKIGAAVGTIVPGVGTIAGAAKGTVIGTLGGAALGAAAGISECMKSTACDGDEAKSNKKEKSNEPKKSDEAKDIKDKKVKDSKAAEEAQKAQQDKAAAEAKKVQDDKIAKDKAAAEENKSKEKQTAAAKKIEDDKKIKDQEMKDAKEAKEKEEEEEENKKKEDDEKKKNDDKLEQRDERAMVTDEEGSGVRKNVDVSTPMAPDENGPQKTFTPGNKSMIITTVKKEKSAQPLKVNTVYPTNPNKGD